MSTRGRMLSTMRRIGSKFRVGFVDMFEYDTPKIVHIRNMKIGIFNRFLQLSIILYIFVYGIILKKGYQKTDRAESTVSLRLKGAVSTKKFNESQFHYMVDDIDLYRRVWDAVDLVYPPTEDDAIFVTTNIVITANQSLGRCIEDPSNRKFQCKSDDKCKKETYYDGIGTGRCLMPKLEEDDYEDDTEGIGTGNGAARTTNATTSNPVQRNINIIKAGKNKANLKMERIKRKTEDGDDSEEQPKSRQTSSTNNTGVCEIEGWCPSSDDILPLKTNKTSLLADTKYLKLVIKNTIRFPIFNLKRRNFLNFNKTFLAQCRNQVGSNEECPIFVLKDIVSRAGFNYDLIGVRGGVIIISIVWNCNLDYDVELCRPKYSFRRFDDPRALHGKGWNVRYANYFDDGTRNLYKAHGIRFVVMVTGTAGKFDLMTLAIKIGSGFGLFALTTICCDLLAFHCASFAHYYKSQKYQRVDLPDEEKGLMKKQHKGEPIKEQPKKGNDEARKKEGDEKSLSKEEQSPKS